MLLFGTLIWELAVAQMDTDDSALQVRSGLASFISLEGGTIPNGNSANGVLTAGKGSATVLDEFVTGFGRRCSLLVQQRRAFALVSSRSISPTSPAIMSFV